MHLPVPTPIIFCDEAGNTGAALLDPTQPVFVLASVNYNADECAELLRLVQSTQSTESKFRSLRKTDRGRKKLLDFFRSPIHSELRAKTTVMHKRYMIVTKLVDMIEETLMHDAGIDLYERGGNISLSNLRYHVSPVFCGKPRFESLLAGFVDMVRTQTPETKYRFFAAVRDAYDNCTDAQYKTSLSPYIHAEECIDDILDGIDFLALDPAIPSFFLHCIEWGKQLGGEFIAIHDASKPMAAQKTTFEAMMDKSITPALIGYDRRKFEFPLKAKKLQFADSKDHLAIQVADLFAEATAYSMSAFTRPDPDSFVHQLGEAGIGRFLFEALWPTKLISPEDLGTTEIGGINTIDHITKTLNKKLF